jgi:hypothetical protein
MRAGDLKTLLATVPNDALIIIESGDHSFREADADYTDVVLEEVWISPRGFVRYKNIREYWERKPEDLDANEKLVQAVIIA